MFLTVMNIKDVGKYAIEQVHCIHMHRGIMTISKKQKEKYTERLI